MLTFCAVCVLFTALVQIVRHVLAIRHARRLRELESREAAAADAVEVHRIIRRVRARTGAMRRTAIMDVGLAHEHDRLARDATIDVRGIVVPSGLLPEHVTTRIVEQCRPVDDKTIEACRARFEHDEYFPRTPEFPRGAP